MSNTNAAGNRSQVAMAYGIWRESTTKSPANNTQMSAATRSWRAAVPKAESLRATMACSAATSVSHRLRHADTLFTSATHAAHTPRPQWRQTATASVSRW